MNRINACFEQLSAQGRKALIPFVTAGDPRPEVTVPLMHAMVDAGADIIELGMPFSDPMADGPVIQLACERSLEAGTRMADVLDMVARFRGKDDTTPVVLMGYLNPVEACGYERFATRAAEAGVDGVLLVDLPPEEAEELCPVFHGQGLETIFLLAPTTDEARMEKIAAAATGYLYYVSLKGVTGSGALNVEEVAERVETIRKHAGLPVGVGFGIKDAPSARAVSAVADGVVVGSALVQRIADSREEPDRVPERVAELLGQMRRAMDQMGEPDHS